MTFSELAEKRYSVRQFKDAPVEQEKLEAILNAGRLAPTACNLQPQIIYVVRSKEGIKKLNRCSRCIYGAPAAFIVCYDKNVSWKRPFDNKDHGDVDASIVTTHMMLEAEERGLGSVWVGYFDPAAVSKEFALPDNLVPSSILPVGYRADGVKPNVQHGDRKPLSETVRYV